MGGPVFRAIGKVLASRPPGVARRGPVRPSPARLGVMPGSVMPGNEHPGAWPRGRR